jgi:hypothetical protein
MLTVEVKVASRVRWRGAPSALGWHGWLVGEVGELTLAPGATNRRRMVASVG